MKAREIIKLLSKLDPNTEVVVVKSNSNSGYPTYTKDISVEEVEVFTNSWYYLVDVETFGKPKDKKTEVIKAIKLL